MNQLPVQSSRALAAVALALLFGLCAQAARAADPPRASSRSERRGGDAAADRDDDDEKDSDDDDRPGRGGRRASRRDDSDDDAPEQRNATVQVKGPVRVRLNLASGRVTVKTWDKQQVDASLSGSGRLRMSAVGDRVEVGLAGRGPRDGRLRLSVPKGTALELSTMSADVEVEGTGGEVRVHSLSGDVRVRGSGAATLETVSGDIEVEAARGAVKVHTVSGGAEISQEGNAWLEFESTSGDLRWSGACGRDCKLDLQTLSGNLLLALAPQSAFELSFATRSGAAHDSFGLGPSAKERRGRKRHGLEAKVGSGEGRIECDTFSGDLNLEQLGSGK